MNIMLIIDSNFVKYVYVLLTSLFINHFSIKFDIYFVYKQMKEQQIKELTDFCNSKGSNAHFIKVDCSGMEELKCTKRYPVELYYKLIPNVILPEKLDRVLFMDIDMVVDGSLIDVYNTKFPEKCCYLACRGGFAFKSYYINGNNNSIEDNYVNSGFMLINLKEMRYRNISLETYKEYLKNNKQKRLEEELLNYTLSNGEIKFLYPFDYNYNVGFHEIYLQYTEANNLKMKKIIRHYMNYGNT